MKPGITQMCLGRKDLQADLKTAKDCGYEAIELFFDDKGVPNIDASAAELKAIRKACDDAGLDLTSTLAFRNDMGSTLSPIAAEREKREAVIRRNIDIAAAVGVDTFLLHPGQLEANDTYERAWNDAVASLKKVSGYAKEKKVNIAIENVWNKFLLSPREARQFIDDCGSDFVGFYLDTGNLIHYGFTEMWIKELGHRIKKVHVKDYRRKDRQFVQLQDGDCNWPAIMAELRKIGFDGALISEVGGDEASLKESAARIRKIMAL